MAVREFILRLHVWVTAALVPLLVKLLPLRALLRLFTPSARLRPYAGVSQRRMVELVARRLRRPRHMRRRACLRRGLVLFHFLRLAGVPALLHIGVFPPGAEADRMKAHCWVSVEGRCLSDPPEGDVAISLVHGGRKGVSFGSFA